MCRNLQTWPGRFWPVAARSGPVSTFAMGATNQPLDLQHLKDLVNLCTLSPWTGLHHRFDLTAEPWGICLETISIHSPTCVEPTPPRHRIHSPQLFLDFPPHKPQHWVDSWNHGQTSVRILIHISNMVSSSWCYRKSTRMPPSLCLW